MNKFLLILLGSLMALPAAAAVGDEFTYEYKGQTLNYTILDEDAKTVEVKAGKEKDHEGSATDDDYTSGNTVTGDLVIPAKVGNDGVEYTVTSIGERAFFMNGGLTSVDIQASVTAIPLSTFFRCESLESVTIPNSVTTIGNSAFHTCSSLIKVTIPESVTSIGAYAFVDCDNLATLTSLCVVAPTSNDAFDGLYNKVSLIVPQAGVDSYIFSEGEWSRFTNISTSEGQKYNIFTDSNGLRYRVVSDNSAILIIGEYTDLTEATIPETLKENDKTFSVTSISSNVFQGCSNLKSVTIPETVTSIGSYAFAGCTALESVTIPESVTSLGSYSFMRCETLKSVTILGSITSIGYNTFARCYDLTSLKIPSSVNSIGGSAFSLCGSLTSLEIPASVTSIGMLAFSDCTGLESVTIPSSVTTIGNAAFKGCTRLNNVISECVTPPTIDSSSFPNYSTATLTIPDGCLEAYMSTNWSCFNNISTKSGETPVEPFVNEGLNYRVLGQNSVMLVAGDYTDMTTVSIPEKVRTADGETYNVTIIGKDAFKGSKITSVVLPGSLNFIGESAFCNSGLTSVTIPESVTGIGNYAFSGCSALTSLTLPKSVSSIGNYAFNECSGLTSVTIPAYVTSIGNYAFYGCSGLISVVLPGSLTYIGELAFCECSSLTSVTIPEKVTGIGSYAFSDCSNLISVTIPASVTYIGSDIFERCKCLRLLDMFEAALSDFSGVAGNLPENTLIFVKAGTSVPEDRANVVVGDICENFVINYGEADNNQLLLSVPHAFTANNVTINRTFTESEPATLYLPFELEADNYGTFYSGGTYSAADQKVYFSEVKDTYTTPNTPYMFIPNQDFSSGITLSNVSVSVIEEDEETVDQLNGVYKMKVFNEDETTSQQYYGWANGQFYPADIGASVDACRAYYKLPASEAANAPARLCASFGNPGTAGVNDINIEKDNDEPAYNIYGQRVGSNYRGVVIKKGKKTINLAR